MGDEARNTDDRPDPATDRFQYSRTALSRLVLSFEQKELANQAAAGVPTKDTFYEPGDMVGDAVQLVDLAQQVLRWAVVYERQRGASWETIGEQLGGITRQSAHERYKAAVEEWEESLLQPFEPPAGPGGYAPPLLHEAALEPTLTGRQLDQWAREHVRSARDDEHPVTGHLPPLTTAEEMNQVLAAIRHLAEVDASPAERAVVYERKANLFDRIAAEDGQPEATEQAAEARARAAELRREAEEQAQ